MCTVLLPPGDSPIAVNKCIISYNSRRCSCDIHTNVQGLEIHIKGFLITTLEVAEWTASCDGRFNRGQNDFLLTQLQDHIRKRPQPIVNCSSIVGGMR